MVLAAAVAIALQPLGTPPAAAASPVRAAVDRIGVTADRELVETAVGGRFTIGTRLSNDTDVATGPLIAHLNVASVTPGVYVDPEDWSSARTQRVGSLAPHEHVQLTWALQAVNAGTFAAYVVLLPVEGRLPGVPLTVSRSISLTVQARQTISAGGVLPVVLAVPLALGLMVLVRARARARRPARERTSS